MYILQEASHFDQTINCCAKLNKLNNIYNKISILIKFNSISNQWYKISVSIDNF